MEYLGTLSTLPDLQRKPGRTGNSMSRATLPFALAAAALASATLPAHAQKQTQANFAQRPYMGWSSWSHFRDRPTEANIKARADTIIANNLVAAGYRYINIDGGWSDGFDEHGIPKPNLTSFPDGMDGVAKYMHAHSLLFGIYLNPGTTVHIADITDTTQPGSTRRGAYRIDFTKPAAAAYIASQVKQLAPSEFRPYVWVPLRKLMGTSDLSWALIQSVTSPLSVRVRMRARSLALASWSCVPGW
jgi:hypothetical protein